MNLAEYSAKHRTRERGMGNGTVVPDGKNWLGLYHVWQGDKRIGRKKVLGLKSAMTKTQAREALRVFLRELENRPATETPAATFRSLAEDFFKLKRGSWSKHWMKCTRTVYDAILLPALGDRRIEEITAQELVMFVNSLPDREFRTSTRYVRKEPRGKLEAVPGTLKTGISKSYVQKVITRLRTIFDFAVEMEPPLLQRNPARNRTLKLEIPKAARKPDKTILPPAETPLLLAALRPRDSLLVRIALYGGLRPGELLALKGAEVCPGWLEVQRALDSDRESKETKTGNRRKAVLPPRTMADLAEWIRRNRIGPTDLVFPNERGKPLSSKNLLNRILRPAAKRAKIRTLEVDWQMLRRTFSTISQLADIPVKSVQAQMGHAKPDMTLIEYQQSIDELLPERLATLEQMVEGTLPIPAQKAAQLGARMVQ